MATHDPAPPPLAMVPQFLRYAGAGALGTAFHYLILIVLVHLAHAGAVAASTVGAVVGAVVNYALNYRYTFASGKKHGNALPRFVLVAVAGIALNAMIVAAVLAATGLHYLVAQVVATGAVLATGYLCNRAWTF